VKSGGLCGQNIWDKNEVILGNTLGTSLELEREHVGNKGKMKKVLLPRPLPKP